MFGHCKGYKLSLDRLRVELLKLRPAGSWRRPPLALTAACPTLGTIIMTCAPYKIILRKSRPRVLAPHTLPRTLCSAHSARTPYLALEGRKGGACFGRCGENLRGRHARTLRTADGSGEPARAWSQPGTWSLRIPAMASSWGDFRPSPMAYPAVRTLPKLPLPVRPETRPTS